MDGFSCGRVAEECLRCGNAWAAWWRNTADAIPALEYFDIHRAWDRLKGDEPFIGTRPKQGCRFYRGQDPRESRKDRRPPADRTVSRVPDGDPARRGPTRWPSLLPGRSVAFGARRQKSGNRGGHGTVLRAPNNARRLLSDDYYASDVAWMDSIPRSSRHRPYEVYEDAFQLQGRLRSVVTVRDKAESAKLAVYAKPSPTWRGTFRFRTSTRTSTEVRLPHSRRPGDLHGGDARRGVQTAAFNSPMTEIGRRRLQEGLLKNVMEPSSPERPAVAARVLIEAQAARTALDPFCNQRCPRAGPRHRSGLSRTEGNASTAAASEDIYSTWRRPRPTFGASEHRLRDDQKWLTSFDEET